MKYFLAKILINILKTKVCFLILKNMKEKYFSEKNKTEYS